MSDRDDRSAVPAASVRTDGHDPPTPFDAGRDVPSASMTAAEIEQRGLALVQDRRRLVSLLMAFVLLVIAIYILFPKVVGLDDTLTKIAEATWYWIAVAIAFNVAAFGAYVALFWGILGGRSDDELRHRLDMRVSYQITMAGLAATRVFSAAGAGGIALTYWALRRAGMGRRRAACRMVAFLVFLYAVYLIAVVIFGILLRTGVLPGANPAGGTIVPAAIAAALIATFGLFALIPQDIERRLERAGRRDRRDRPLARIARRVASGPATVAMGVRTAIAYMRSPKRAALAIGGAIGFWAANIGILWASFRAFGGDVAFGVLVQGFFVGMAANLIPSPAGGVGSVDAGMIAAFVLFGVSTEIVFAAVLTYRVIAFWLPIPPGVLAYLQLRRTVSGWHEGDAATIQSKVKAEVG